MDIKSSGSSQNAVQSPLKQQIMYIVSIIWWFFSDLSAKHSALSVISALNYDKVA